MKGDNILQDCDGDLKRLIDQSCEKGSSNWFSCLPLKDHGFIINKSEFQDSLCLRYGNFLQVVPAGQITL